MHIAIITNFLDSKLFGLITTRLGFISSVEGGNKPNNIIRIYRRRERTGHSSHEIPCTIAQGTCNTSKMVRSAY